jgi:hypothetical protein
MANIDADLLNDVKDYLCITWADEKEDKKITGFINRGMARLRTIAGAPLDFTKEDLPRSLLLDYCRYANSQALEVFEKNFESELLELNFTYQTMCSLTVISLPGTAAGFTRITVSPEIASGNSYMVQTGNEIYVPMRNDICGTAAGYTAWDGAAEIVALTGDDIVIVEVDSTMKAIAAGRAIVTARAQATQ